MTWESFIKQFETHLRLERSLSINTILAYVSDIRKLQQFIALHQAGLSPVALKITELQAFLIYLHSLGIANTSQARIIAAIRSFYQFLALEITFQELPTKFLSSPNVGRKLPYTLAVHEIETLFNAIDHSSPLGMRNRAMLETLYSSGLRVTELITLKLSHIYFEEGFLRVVGKGDKERLVPIGQIALKYLRIYIQEVRCHQVIEPKFENYVFLNKRGTGLTRVMVFLIIKELVHKVGLKIPISPHTFRHSFATHLIEGGADLRAVQAMLGHESITTTEIYTHLDRSYLQQTIHDFHPRSPQRVSKPTL
jgi:integrase/recombinase XerD